MNLRAARRPAAALAVGGAFVLSGCLPLGPATPEPVEKPGKDLTWDAGPSATAGSARLHEIVATYDDVLAAWRAAEATGDLVAAQQGAVAYAEALRPMRDEIRAESFDADYADSAKSVLRVVIDAIASAENAAVAPTTAEYDAAVVAGYGTVGARTELSVLLIWV